MDLFGPTRTASIGGKRYVFVIIDDFSRFTWVIFLTHKMGFATLKYFVEKFKEKRVILFVLFIMIMAKNSRTKPLKIFVLKMNLLKISRRPDLHSKMV